MLCVWCGGGEGKGEQRPDVVYVESRTQRNSVVNEDNFFNRIRGLKISNKVIRGLVLLC
jgi:hypothetical protein